MANPLIQIDDEVREMTDEEFAELEASRSEIQPLNLETTQE